MLFNSYEFIFVFLPITLALYLSLGTAGYTRTAIGALVTASVVYYARPFPEYLAILGFSIVANYTLGRALTTANEAVGPGQRRTLLFAGICLNLGLIGYFKYAYFLAQTLQSVAGVSVDLAPKLLPLGISFFTFQQIAYLVDAYRGVTRKYGFLQYSLFVSFFPQLVAGPIVRHDQLIPQFERKDLFKLDLERTAQGLTFFILGLFKKVVLADGIAFHADTVFGAAGVGAPVGFAAAWSGALAYAFQIYFDFSGYSDMAVGLGLVCGVRIPFNFASPYKAPNIIEFWRRWHMTLSAFLRDYLYIPLGGNRKGKPRRYINLTITMLLGGLWHGAGWNFVLWGAVHAGYLMVNHAWRSIIVSDASAAARLHYWGRAAGQLATFVVVVIAWVLFRSESPAAIREMLAGLAGINGVGQSLSPSVYVPLATMLCIIWFAPNTQEWILGEDRWWRWRPSNAIAVLLAVLAYTSILYFSRGFAHENVFIYYQF